MKYNLKTINLFTLLALFVAMGYSQAPAGSIPRTGNRPNLDNTYRTLSYAYDSVSQYTTGALTHTLHPHNFHTQVYVGAVLDSVLLNITDTTASFKGDELEIQIVNGPNSTAAVKFTGGHYQTATTTAGGNFGTIYLVANKRASIIFHYDGRYWVEVSRMVQ